MRFPHRSLTRFVAVLATFVMSTALVSESAAAGGFLFATFRGEQTPLTEQVYFGLSRDGRQWKALNEGKPVLVSELGEKGARDPFLLRRHDGKGFVLIATDLSINRNGDWGRAVTAGSRSILIWESADLVTWSAPRLVPVAPEDAGCTWAPEAVYDEDRGEYLVFWASKTKRDGFAKHRIWAARTKDFQTFGAPFVYIERPGDIIDTTIIHDGSAYYRFSKDEVFKAIQMETGKHLDGPWTMLENFSLAKTQGFEGPACYVLEPASAGKRAVWCLLIDHYAKGQGYKPFVTDDLASAQFKPGAGISFPFHFRHGGLLRLSEAEFAKVEKVFAK